MKVLKLALVITFVALFSAACSTPSESANKNATPAANANASKPSTEAAANSNQPAMMEGGNSSIGAPKSEAKPAAAGDTAKVFTEKCAMCHGEDGKGKAKGVPDFTSAEWQKKEQDSTFATVIKTGKKPMPGFGDKLNDEQVNALVAYVRAFAKK
jgi:mono/diheme cytochrome c family protein